MPMYSRKQDVPPEKIQNLLGHAIGVPVGHLIPVDHPWKADVNVHAFRSIVQCAKGGVRYPIQRKHHGEPFSMTSDHIGVQF